MWGREAFDSADPAMPSPGWEAQDLSRMRARRPYLRLPSAAGISRNVVGNQAVCDFVFPAEFIERQRQVASPRR